MTPPLIGITTYGRDEQKRFLLPAEYVDAVRQAGGIPVLLPPGETNLNELLTRLDGCILAGGGDLEPTLYGGRQHDTIYMVDSERDKSEIALARELVELEVPTLGICRGTQVLNVALGGTLIEHLPDVVGEAIPHRLPPRLPSRHQVLIKSSSRLAKILRETQINPASWHHQAIRQVASSLEVAAQAADGTIEAVEKSDHPWLIAVQWHPELTTAVDPVQRRLFDGLVRTAAELGQNRREQENSGT